MKKETDNLQKNPLIGRLCMVLLLLAGAAVFVSAV